MTDAFAGYDEPASPDRKLATDRRTRGADDVDLQQIVLFDETAENGAAVDSSGRLKVDASGVAVPVTDNGSSLTVDGTVTADTELPTAAALADNLANPTTPLAGAANLLWDTGSSVWVRQRASHSGFGLASAARTTTQTSGDIASYNWRGLHLVVNVTSAGTGSITPKITGRETIIGTDYDLLVATSAITANGTYVYELYPGVSAGAAGITQSLSRALPRTFRITITHNNANSITYSYHYCGIV